MRATKKNKYDKIENNAKIREGECIFPFKYKWKTHNECLETKKGLICATSVNPKSKTLTHYQLQSHKINDFYGKFLNQKNDEYIIVTVLGHKKNILNQQQSNLKFIFIEDIIDEYLETFNKMKG